MQGYITRVLIQHGPEGWEAISKDFKAFPQGYGATEKEAMDMLKRLLKDRIQKMHDAKDQFPHTEITAYRRIGGRMVFVLVKPEKTDAT